MATDATPGPSTPTLSIIVPTYQESANIPVLFECVKVALDGLPWEMIVVDDNSPDGTSNVAFALAAKDHRLRCLRRVNRSGLAGAVIEGWMSEPAQSDGIERRRRRWRQRGRRGDCGCDRRCAGQAQRGQGAADHAATAQAPATARKQKLDVRLAHDLFRKPASTFGDHALRIFREKHAWTSSFKARRRW